MGRSERAGDRPIPGPQDRRDIARVLLPLPDLDERADDRPHHLVAERGRLDLEPEHPVAQVVPPGRVDGAHEAAVGHLAAERGEVVLADERIAGQAQPGQVERRRDVPGRGGQERIGHGSIQHGVAVAPVRRRVPGVEVIGRDLEGAHDDRGGAHPVHRPLQRRQVERIERRCRT